MRILTAGQMREADRRAIQDIGLPSVVLMENAGRHTVAAIDAFFSDIDEGDIAVVSGIGNNGGDGFVVARILQQRGAQVSVFVIGQLADIRGDARVNLDVLGQLGISVVEISNQGQWELHASEVTAHQLIVDALFGTGLRAPLGGLYETVIADINECEVPVVSIDLPSGLSADSAEVIGPCIDATLTVTLGAPKLPLILPPAEAHCGAVVIADIGIPNEVIRDVPGSHLELVTREAMRGLISPRANDAHKGDFGHVLVVAGSRGKSGAAVLAAQGALRSGAGLVSIACPQDILPMVAAHAPEYMTVALASGADGRVTRAAADEVLNFSADVVALGPGLGQGDEVREFVRELLAKSETPLIVDADGLNAFAHDSGALRGREGREVIITPHPGEMARLVGGSVEDVQADRIGIAREFARAQRLYVVLKGYRTLIATPAGKVFVNPTGSAGMATGGTGDVLTGMLASWLAQLLDAEAACRLAVYLHGAAGELAEADQGEVSMLASDLVQHISDAVLELSARKRVAAKDE